MGNVYTGESGIRDTVMSRIEAAACTSQNASVAYSLLDSTINEGGCVAYTKVEVFYNTIKVANIRPLEHLMEFV